MNTLFSILLATGAFLLLAIYGAGIFPWTVIVATVALCLAARRRRKTTDYRPQTADLLGSTALRPWLRAVGTFA